MIKLINLLNEMYDKDLIGSEYGEGGQHKIYDYFLRFIKNNTYRINNNNNNNKYRINNNSNSNIIIIIIRIS
jgi:hypothetical protein